MFKVGRNVTKKKAVPVARRVQKENRKHGFRLSEEMKE
jgi:hypothetical protein